MRRTYVIAYDYAHFRQWCRRNGYDLKDQTYYYVKDYTSLYGLGWHDFDIIGLSGWKRRGDYYQLLLTIDALKRANGSRRSRKMEDSGLFTWKFWKRALERAIRALAVSLGGIILTDSFNALEAGWRGILGAAALAAMGSLVLSVIGSQVGDKSDPSLVK